MIKSILIVIPTIDSKIHTQTTISLFKMEKILTEVGPDKINNTKFQKAFDLFRDLVLSSDFEEFLTTPAYKFL